MSAQGTFKRGPPVYEEAVPADTLSYLKGYPLFNQRLNWAVENRSLNLPYSDLRLYIARLMDPLAFECGETETIEDVEHILNNTWESEQGLSEGIRIRTMIDKLGKFKWFKFRHTDSRITSTIDIGYFSPSDLSSDPITYPSSAFSEEANWTELRVTLEDWQEQLDDVFWNLEEGASFELYLGPSENGMFSYGLSVERT